MKYTFLLPAYKAKYFYQAIKSIVDQTYTDFELVVVNDASPEDLDSIVKRFDDPRIKYYKNQDNIGGKSLVTQWNKCLQYASGDYIILASDDDKYAPEYLSMMAKLVDKYPDVNVFRPRIQMIDGADNILHIEGYLAEHVSSLEYMYLLQRHVINGGIPYYVLKKEALLEIGGFYDFPMAWGSDDATIIALSKDKGLVSSTDVLFSFRMSGENITSKRNDYHMLKQKITARNMYFDFQKVTLADYSPVDDLDNVYLNYLNKHSEKSIVHSIYELLCDSTLIAGLKCLPLLLSLPYIKVRWLLICYIKRIGQTFFYS